MMLLFGIGMYPDMVHSTPNPAHSLTIYNAASSEKTLTIMLIIAGLGVPIVLAYTASIYWIFRGKQEKLLSAWHRDGPRLLRATVKIAGHRLGFWLFSAPDSPASRFGLFGELNYHPPSGASGSGAP